MEERICRLCDLPIDEDNKGHRCQNCREYVGDCCWWSGVNESCDDCAVITFHDQPEGASK